LAPTAPPEVRPGRLAAVTALGVILWFIPAPAGLTLQAWHLFALFLGTILAILVRALPILPAAIAALALAVLSKTLEPAQAFSGFSQDFLLLIVAAFLVSRAVVACGLGRRIALHVIRRLGGSPLGLGYSIFLADACIAPGFPSNTARSGVLFPVVEGLCRGSGSLPHDGTRRRLGHYLMMAGIASLSLSSGLWMTAMATNPAGAALAREQGVAVTFGSWTLAALLPSLVALALVPWVLLKAAMPGAAATPEAPRAAAEALRAMGPMGRAEWITAGTFALMVALWALGDLLAVSRAAVALLGLAVLMVTGVYTLRDLSREGEALSVWLWFGILYTLSTYLNQFGFMTWAAAGFARMTEGWPAAAVYLALVLTYVLMHYLFVSQTAHLLALFGLFLSLGTGAGLPAPLVAYMLLFATNFFSAVTPQGSSANVLFAGSGYLTTGELYGYGAIVTAANTAIFLAVGTPWILLLF
jgi:DASS family divalent anion:Na+ symporter